MGDIDDVPKINGVLAAALAWREIDRDHAGDAPELRRYLLSQYEQRLREAVDRWADMVPAFAWQGVVRRPLDCDHPEGLVRVVEAGYCRLCTGFTPSPAPDTPAPKPPPQDPDSSA